jgi:beta-galactosidase/beta-glucuronidase
VGAVDGTPRVLLNGKPYFFNGVLDQGYFSDGIYTPASPKEYENDILAMKSLGFNTLRKHIKVEPEEFYYQCDRIGMVVFQDMVNNGKYSFLRDTALPTIGIKKLPESWIKRTSAQKDAFVEGMRRTVNQLYNHPSVCYYTIFNEGWGQFDSDKMFYLLKELDSSRIIDTNSGWFGGHKSDVESNHIYFKKIKLKKSNKPLILGEFGGYSYKIKEHSANLKKTYGYKLFDDGEKFEDALISLYENEVISEIENGLCGAIYTQLSDVEDETNGFLTYDRKICKVNCDKVRLVMQKAKI